MPTAGIPTTSAPSASGALPETPPGDGPPAHDTPAPSSNPSSEPEPESEPDPSDDGALPSPQDPAEPASPADGNQIEETPETASEGDPESTGEAPAPPEDADPSPSTNESPTDTTSEDPPASDDSGASPPGDPADGEEPDGETPDGDLPPVADGAGTGNPGLAETPGGLDDFHLTVIGSSTAAGIGASRDELSWASLLDRTLRARVVGGFSSSNLARGGYTAKDLLSGSGSPGSIDDALAERPDLILVALAGSNDLSPSFTTEMFIGELASVRDTARAADVPVFFVGTLPKNFGQSEREILVAWDRAMADEFSSCWIPALGTTYSPCFVNVYDALADTSLGLAAELDSGDGQHPNDAGHDVLFSAIAPVVTAYVCATTSCR